MLFSQSWKFYYTIFLLIFAPQVRSTNRTRIIISELTIHWNLELYHFNNFQLI